MRKLISFLPSIITSISVLCGFLSLKTTADGDFKRSAWLIILAIFMDALDGRVARATKMVSKFGEQYDSLADTMSFGVAPAFLALNLMLSLNVNSNIAYAASFLIVLSGALRLARFNITEDKKSAFTGMPIPGGAGIISSYILLCLKYNIAFNGSLLVFLCISISMLMISKLRYFSGKEKKAGRGKRKMIFFGVIALALVIRFHIEFFAFMGMLYLCYGPVMFVVDKITRKNTVKE